VVLAKEKPLYARIRTSTGSTVYVMFDAGKLYVAESAAKLKTAEAISGKETRGAYHSYSFPEVDLPFPSARLPKGVSKVTARMVVYVKPSTSLFLRLGTCHEEKIKEGDEEKVSVWKFGSDYEGKLGRSASTAATYKVPNRSKLDIKLATISYKGMVGVVLTVWSSNVKIDAIERDGKTVPVKVSIENSAGKEVFSGKGEVDDFCLG
jgi:hypothetical protein